MKEKPVITKVYAIAHNGITHEFAGRVEHSDHYSARMVFTDQSNKKTVGSMIHRIPKSEMDGATVFEAEVTTRYKL